MAIFIFRLQSGLPVSVLWCGCYWLFCCGCVTCISNVRWTQRKVNERVLYSKVIKIKSLKMIHVSSVSTYSLQHWLLALTYLWYWLRLEPSARRGNGVSFARGRIVLTSYVFHIFNCRIQLRNMTWQSHFTTCHILSHFNISFQIYFNFFFQIGMVPHISFHLAAPLGDGLPLMQLDNSFMWMEPLAH
jgi:hypothetical protein